MGVVTVEVDVMNGVVVEGLSVIIADNVEVSPGLTLMFAV